MNIKNIFFICYFYTLVLCYSDNYQKLYKWITDNGAFISNKIIPKENSIYNRCLITSDKIKEKEIILFIPDKVTISTLNKIVLERCKKDFSDFLSFAEKEEKASFDYDCLVYFLTIDMENKNSFFRPYYDYLPEISKSEYPIYFSEEEKISFNKIELETQIRRQEFFFNKSLKPIKNKIIKIENRIENFKKNFIYVSTRNFGRRGSFFQNVNTMVPFLDLLNHNNDYNTWFNYDEKRDGFVLYATRDIQINEELTLSYGRYNNVYLYALYGFTIKNNIFHSSIHIKIKDEVFTLFEKNKENEIMKIVKYFRPKSVFEGNNIILQIKYVLENKLYDYQQFIQKYKDNNNIINICDDLIYSVKQYISLCEKLI